MVKKSHINDVFAITGGNVQERNRSYGLTQTRRNNRSLHTNRKGFKPSIRRKRYRLQPNDLVEHKGLFCKVKGAYNYGKYVILVDKT